MSSFTSTSTESSILDPLFLPSPTTVGYSWHLKLTDPKIGRREEVHKVSFRHCPVTGIWVLIINNEFRATGSEAIYNRKFFVKLALKPDDDGLIDLDGSGSVGYVVRLRLNGVEHEESRTLPDISVGEAIPVLATVPGYRLGSTADGPTVYYQVFVKTSAGEEHMLEKRYSEINHLDALIRAQTASHLVRSLPSLPGKVWNPWTDQTSETFIHQRRTALELYFSMLIGNAKVVHYQETLVFFGLDPITGLLATSTTSAAGPAAGGAAGGSSGKKSSTTSSAPSASVAAPPSSSML